MYVYVSVGCVCVDGRVSLTLHGLFRTLFLDIFAARHVEPGSSRPRVSCMQAWNGNACCECMSRTFCDTVARLHLHAQIHHPGATWKAPLLMTRVMMATHIAPTQRNVAHDSGRATGDCTSGLSSPNSSSSVTTNRSCCSAGGSLPRSRPNH